ncbi:pyridoxal-dependent decarboxylase domain protein [Aspergillus terreus]|uniref:Pyridoxal-dependent decarboxylase domain protein n=1 Tax=Aspergillus terreus TaxID=33178 RepID=A0A5M3ZDP1_ASPTE|nr:hypothetical protein ATETN484_0015001300 [Aspergillus terreus]GFF14882.1 pyridoxal-dependent decarboxylase domain protein [Aspergillus terreus]
MAPKDEAHQIISSYFIGPKAENIEFFRKNLNRILHELKNTRNQYHKDDESFITEDTQNSEKFQTAMKNFSEAVTKAASLLGQHSIPFWSPRYQGHMCSDLTVPGLLGYFMTMLYNPNNVALEASPFTTVVELKAGQQLCDLFGYNIDPNWKQEPLAWGHITADGTIANLESVWVARNLKFYPLALFMAIKEDALWFVADRFKVTTCLGDEKLFRDLSVWELLNLKPDTVLGLPDALSKEFNITGKYLEGVMQRYNIQTAGKECLERYFGINRPFKIFASSTRHYSWPKSAAIAGIGSINLHGIEVDLDGRVDLEDLEAELNRCVEERQAVYAVVAIVGSTEEGAVDRLQKIIGLRKKFQNKGLSFLVHADAAWGGYFMSIIEKRPARLPIKKKIGVPRKKIEGFVPSLTLKEETVDDFLALKHTDSITVDPHKAGYVPYPAGALCYRDGRMRFLVTWSSPYLSQGSRENIGIYGVEGSKPGASGMATWFSNQVIGLNTTGYGRLLGEASFTSARLSAHYAAMHVSEKNEDENKHRYFICIPFNRLPSEMETDSEEGDPSSKKVADKVAEKVENERQWIYDNILPKSNDEISQNNDLMQFIRKLGSDTNINAFALNWIREDGKPNEDIEEANYFMKNVVDRLSINTTDGDPTKIPLYLTSTKFEPELYGKSAQHFMKRLRITPCSQDLFVLRNVVMSPFPTDGDFIGQLVDYLQEVIIQEAKRVRERNKAGRYYAKFLMRGTGEIFLEYLPSFYRATGRQQVIFQASLDEEAKKRYVQLQSSHKHDRFLLRSSEKIDIERVVENGERFKGKISIQQESSHDMKFENEFECEVQVGDIVISRPLNSTNRDQDYPQQFTPFYLYGSHSTETHSRETHISHMLLKAPNISLSSRNISLDQDLADIVDEHLDEGLILVITNAREACMHPFPGTNKELADPFFFRRWQEHDRHEYEVKVYKDPKRVPDSSMESRRNPFAEGPGLLDQLGSPLKQGTMKLTGEVYVDVELVHEDPVKPTPLPPTNWEDKLQEIKDVLNGKYHISSSSS